MPDLVTYTAVLPIGEPTVAFVSNVLAGESARRGGTELARALLADRTAGYHHVHLDGTLIRTDRSRAIGPTAGVDLWWSANTTTTAATCR